MELKCIFQQVSMAALTLFLFLDIDECVTGKNQCPYNRQCVNTFGSYYCKCQGGYDLKYINSRYDCEGEEDGSDATPCQAVCPVLISSLCLPLRC